MHKQGPQRTHCRGILTPSGVVSGKAAKTLRGLFHPLSLQNDYHSNNGNKKWPSQGHALANGSMLQQPLCSVLVVCIPLAEIVRIEKCTRKQMSRGNCVLTTLETKPVELNKRDRLVNSACYLVHKTSFFNICIS